MKTQMKKGILEIFVLGFLKKEDSYGYKIVQELYNRTTNGNINLRNVVAIDIDSVTTNGKIIASIVGDSDEFKMDLRVTNGKIYLGDFVLASQVLNPTKTNIIRLHTTNGNIEIEFVE